MQHAVLTPVCFMHMNTHWSYESQLRSFLWILCGELGTEKVGSWRYRLTELQIKLLHHNYDINNIAMDMYYIYSSNYFCGDYYTSLIWSAFWCLHQDLPNSNAKEL